MDWEKMSAHPLGRKLLLLCVVLVSSSSLMCHGANEPHRTHRATHAAPAEGAKPLPLSAFQVPQICGSMSQPQPVRAGDVYPASADPHEARRERDKVVEQQGQEQSGGGGLRVTETDLPGGRRMVTTSAGDQVMAQFTVPVPDQNVAEATDAVTVGEALQAAAQTSAGDRPVGLADAAALQAAEMRATGLGGNLPGGVAAAAQRAAETNMMMRPAEEESGNKAVRIRDVVGDAAAVLPANKVATREDAEKVAAAAARNEGKRAGARGGGGKGSSGVVDVVAAAADMNEGRMM